MPIWVVYMTAFTFLAPSEPTDWPFTDPVLMFAIALLLAPTQSGGGREAFLRTAKR